MAISTNTLMHIPEHVPELKDSIHIFKLLKENIDWSLTQLEDSSSEQGHFLAIRSLFIDLTAFYDELKIFVHNVRVVKPMDIKGANNFLLLSTEPRNILRKYEGVIRELRNLVFAHHFRDKDKRFHSPLTIYRLNFHTAPLMKEEIISLAEIALLVIWLARESFPFMEDMAHTAAFEDYEKYKRLKALMENKIPMINSVDVETIKRNLYNRRDLLRSHADNYALLGRKIRCKILVETSPIGSR